MLHEYSSTLRLKLLICFFRYCINMAEDEAVADFLAREKEALAGLDDFEELHLVAATDCDDTTKNEENSAAPMTNGLPENEISQNTGSSTPAVLPAPQESENMIKWREEQKARLAAKDEKEEEEKAKWRELAETDLQEWYKNRQDHIEKVKKTNRMNDAEFLSGRDSEQPGQEWERITHLCDFNPKSCRSQKDVSRMRSMFLQLKANPKLRSEKTVNS
ncbi:Clathrin light chain A [Trichinella pseudospiralis]|uniref:Clathrin light chain n=1 Tax=Trichinella pseudospiralis TaxID=6337 RepID=A0A0V1FL99_TRIPS|nr:Clathrin light chain A [Trichinella pseudospiralis]KRY86824.1 Clathrin light chain A [Trichinella pseudospiralis]